MPLQFTTSYLEDSLSLLRYYKKLGERAMDQVEDPQLFAVIDDEANSIAIVVKHMTGNMRSRWTDFLTTDGEKPDRNRDAEFIDPPKTREALLNEWEAGWACVFQALEAGASGYLAKSAPADTLVEALRLVIVGGIYVPRALIKGRESRLRQPAAVAQAPVLTPRQREILALISTGRSNKEIAHRLGTSDGTIKAHISAIMRRLGVRNRVQLLLTAQQLGFTMRPAG